MHAGTAMTTTTYEARKRSKRELTVADYRRNTRYEQKKILPRFTHFLSRSQDKIFHDTRESEETATPLEHRCD